MALGRSGFASVTRCPCQTPITHHHPLAYHKDGKHIRVCSQRCLNRVVELRGEIPAKETSA